MSKKACGSDGCCSTATIRYATTEKRAYRVHVFIRYGQETRRQNFHGIGNYIHILDRVTHFRSTFNIVDKNGFQMLDCHLKLRLCEGSSKQEKPR